MMIQSRCGTMLNTDLMESYKRSRGRFCFTVTMASGKEYLVDRIEIRKAYPDAE